MAVPPGFSEGRLDSEPYVPVQPRNRTAPNVTARGLPGVSPQCLLWNWKPSCLRDSRFRFGGLLNTTGIEPRARTLPGPGRAPGTCRCPRTAVGAAASQAGRTLSTGSSETREAGGSAYHGMVRALARSGALSWVFWGVRKSTPGQSGIFREGGPGHGQGQSSSSCEREWDASKQAPPCAAPFGSPAALRCGRLFGVSRGVPKENAPGHDGEPRAQPRPPAGDGPCRRAASTVTAC